MTRSLYRCLMRLHPPAFRREFAGEMLWIFEEVSAAEGATSLLVDGLVSLFRQWVIRNGTWKVAAAALGGLLYMGLALGMMPRTGIVSAKASVTISHRK